MHYVYIFRSYIEYLESQQWCNRSRLRCFGSLEFGGLLPEIFGGRLPERAYIVYDPILGGEKYLKYFKRFAGAKKNIAKTEQFYLKTFDPFLISLFAHTKIRFKNTPLTKVHDN